MRKLGKLFLLGLFTVVLSCSKSSNDDTPPEEPPVAVDKRANLLATGDSANDILSNNNFDRLLIEIGFVTGFRPTNEALNNLAAFLRQHTFKQEIEYMFTELDSPNEDDLTLQEIANLEEDNRTAYNNGNTLAVYIYFADAPSEGDEEEEGLVTLGAVYRNTSMIIHESTIRNLAARSPVITNADVEEATLNHEFGHLFGLVNLGTEAINDHESQSENNDGELVGDNHCNVEGCLMRAELQFNASGKSAALTARSTYEDGVKAGCVLSGKTVLSLLQSNTARGAAPPGLDAECILDIQGNGAR
ncbi:hypothetical protein [Maribacter sp. 2210JD10-5]|uniref:hypothetical protein n=1 Tax=Maribacter sp. 2210JD10-5 TaxID=3386272 RepID=UPI0039BD1AFB